MGKRDEVLTDRISELERVVGVLREIRDNPDVGERKICEKHGISFNRFRRNAYDLTWIEKPSKSAKTEEDTAARMREVCPTLSWYEILWCAVLGMRYGDTKACPTDLQETFEYLFENYLSEAEETVIRLRYRSCMSLEETAKFMGNMTRERVTQIEARAFRALRRTAGWIIRGKNEVIPMLKIQRDLENNIELSTYYRVLHDLDSRIVPLKAIIQYCLREEIKNRFTDRKNVLIEDLDFSVRTYNCLKRAGINTLDELGSMTRAEIEKVRNLGRKSVEEVVDKLMSLNIDIADNDDQD